MKRTSLFCGLLTAALISLPASATVPTYVDVELQARSNLIVNDKGFNVPPGTSFNSISANLNDEGQVTFTAGVVPIGGDLSRSGAGLWFGGHGKGHFVAVHEPPPGDPKDPPLMLISDRPGINNLGQVVYRTSVDLSAYVLRKYDAATDTSNPVSLLPLTPTSIDNPGISDGGTIGFKGRFGGGSGIAAVGPGPATLYAFDSNVDPTGYAYIYSPATSATGKIAVKVSTSDYSHNEIRLFGGPGDSTLLVADKATDGASPFGGFDNGLAVNAHGAIAVVVKLADGNVRAVYRFTPGESGIDATEIARVDPAGDVRVIDAFAPAINDDGLVVFRGEDANGQAVFAGDGKTIVRVIGKGDAVSTDLGPGQLGQHDTSPVFSGAPAVNGYGDVAFVAGLHPEGNNQEEWGSGVFVVYADRPVGDDTIFEDGFDTAANRR
ncbi:choice-of-anchor tandem repeat NxxGxxAF-containing protein [Dokdonella sp.]|uniref:choice-of-anchor tandem repeat NxxGxxAF-containing protein n=1 Tax=Dokdonella sp. TaxID=2291710 RepID=UPI002603D02C|nr:choice-of-anchor tandem repeat NxxGxxAF-containing protein [Dokdonella sp.]